MCGIAGVVYSDRSRRVSPEIVKDMCDRIVHRGPDDYGAYVDGPVGIGMRRLSIIDLHTGHQPICNEDRTVWIVFNGEIYNYRALRERLEKNGHRFATATDTEVIVHLYEEEGVHCVKSLRGMFAFAIWDLGQELLLLARDRIGIKPLYFCENRDGIVFGSELRALLVVEDITRDLNPQAVAEYFTHLCVPGDLSIYQSVRKLLPGHVLVFQRGRSQITRYWSLKMAPDLQVTESEWIEQLQSYFTDAVTSHMVADVPVGAFLSGGVDSGSMVAIMAKYSTVPVRTFTVGFKTGAGQFDETAAARAVATSFHTQHHECLLEADVAALFSRVVGAIDEPFADSSIIPNWLVCQETARHVKVALSGLGGDELFGGYERYLGLDLGEAYLKLPRVLRRTIAALLRHWPAGDGFSYVGDRVRRFAEASERPLAERYRSFIVAFDDVRQILHPDIRSIGIVSRYAKILKGLNPPHPIDLGMLVDFELYLPDDLLRLSDQISMAHSLEIRVPFMDHEFMEFVARIPARYKIHGFQKKYILKKAMAPWLPEGHMNRPKQGFSIPLAAWLRGSLRSMANDLVQSRRCKESPWINQDCLHRMMKEHMSGQANHEVRLWGVLCFLEWERQQHVK